MINIYQLQNLAPILLCCGLYIDLGAKWLFVLCGVFVGFYKKIPPKIRRIIVFFLIGCGRGLIDFPEENYTFSYTSFEAKVIDYQIREKKSYLLLTEFKPKKKVSSEYQLDEFAQFPREALMEIEDIDKYKTAEKVECIGRFYLPMPPINIHLKKKPQVRGIIKSCKMLKENNNNFKDFLRKKFHRNLNKEAADFSSAIFLSDTFAIPKEQRKVYEKAGLAHILGVSVLNLTIILIFLFSGFYYLIGFCWINSAYFLPINIIAQILSFSLILVYCYLIGFEYPLIRVLFMSFLSIFTLFLSKKNDVENLFLIASLILFFDPLAIYDLGFQFSFAGVLGIYSLGIIHFKNWIYSSFWTTFSAVLLIAPLSIFHFQQFAFQPFLANLLVIPFLTFVIIPSLLLYIFLPNFIASYLACFVNIEFNFLSKMVCFLAKTAQNVHFLPIFYIYFICFFIFFLLFSILKEKVRYFFLFLAYSIFCFGLFRASQYSPFLLISMSHIGLVLQDKIIVYPKCGVVGDLWSEYYNLPAFDGAHSGYFKNDCNKIIVFGVGIIRKAPHGFYSLPTTKDYVFLPADLMQKIQVIYLR